MTTGIFNPKIRLVPFIIFTAVISIALILMLSSFSTPKQITFPQGYEIGVWEWRDVTELETTDISKEFSDLKTEGINTIYLEISTVGYINELPEYERLQEISKIEESIKEYIKTAGEYGIKVQALAGENIWGNAANRQFPLGILDFVFEYNAKVSVDERFTGIQYNIEQYNQDGFSKSKDKYMNEYFETLKQLASKYIDLYKQDTSNKTSFSLGFTAPFWMDGSNSSFKEIKINGEKKFPVFHMIDILQDVPNAYIAILDYRNYTDGQDGSIENIRDELNYLMKKNSSVDLTVGQETTYVEPLKITFFGFSKESLKKAVTEISNSYKGHPNLRGFSIHTLQSYIELSSE